MERGMESQEGEDDAPKIKSLQRPLLNLPHSGRPVETVDTPFCPRRKSVIGFYIYFQVCFLESEMALLFLLGTHPGGFKEGHPWTLEGQPHPSPPPPPPVLTFLTKHKG